MTGVTEPQPTPTTRLPGVLLLSALLRRTAVDGAGHGLGRLSDIIVRLREGDYPAVTGLVANVGGRELFIPADEILAWDDQHLELGVGMDAREQLVLLAVGGVFDDVRELGRLEAVQPTHGRARGQ